jgi:hypothetical protein
MVMTVVRSGSLQPFPMATRNPQATAMSADAPKSDLLPDLGGDLYLTSKGLSHIVSV